MLGRNSKDDGKPREDNQASSSIQSISQSDMMAELKTFLRNEIKENFESMENRLLRGVEEWMGELTEQQAELQANMERMEKLDSVVLVELYDQLTEHQAELQAKMERMEKKLDSLVLVQLYDQLTEQQAELQSNMERVEKKLDSLVLAEKRLEETVAASCATQEMLQAEVAHAADAPFQSNQGSVSEHQLHQGAQNWLGCVGAVIPMSNRYDAVHPQGRRSNGNPVTFTQPPQAMNLNRAMRAVTTVACTVQMVHNVNNRSNSHDSRAVTTPTFMYEHPRTYAQSQHCTSSVRSRGSCGQNGVSCGQSNDPNILPEVLAIAREFHCQLSSTRGNSATSNNQIRLSLEHFDGNTLNVIMALVSNDGHQVASRSHTVSGEVALLSPVLDQNLNAIQHLPWQVPVRRRASRGGIILTEGLMMEISKMMVGPNWKKVGIACLGFKSDFLRDLDDKHQDSEMKIFEMIKHWSRSQGLEGGTVERLLKLLKDCIDIDPDVKLFMNDLIESPEPDTE